MSAMINAEHAVLRTALHIQPAPIGELEEFPCLTRARVAALRDRDSWTELIGERIRHLRPDRRIASRLITVTDRQQRHRVAERAIDARRPEIGAQLPHYGVQTPHGLGAPRVAGGAPEDASRW